MTDGLLSDTRAQMTKSFQVEVGNQGIKSRRRMRQVPLEPGGVVADYAPFYFAPRSPMMFAIERGGVSTYQGGCDDLIYLVSSVERVDELGLTVLFTDRNAVLEVASFSDSPADLDELVDWQLMKATYWNNTEREPDRRERRMAECLVHDAVPWTAFGGIIVRNPACEAKVQAQLASVGAASKVVVRPDWYF